MMPVIQAEESLSNITVAAIAGCNLKKGESERIQRLIKKQALRREPKQIQTSQSKYAALSMMGIGIIDTRKKKKEVKNG